MTRDEQKKVMDDCLQKMKESGLQIKWWSKKIAVIGIPPSKNSKESEANVGEETS